MITNPTPITAGTFNGMWITSLQIVFPTSNNAGNINAKLLPFDGTHLLASGSKNLRAKPSQLQPATLTNLVNECKRQAGKTVEPLSVMVSAMEVERPVAAMIQFSDKTMHRIPDCYSLAGSDNVFGAMFQSVMAEIATLAGCTVS